MISKVSNIKEFKSKNDKMLDMLNVKREKLVENYIKFKNDRNREILLAQIANVDIQILQMELI
jgi:hypothetical protein